MKTITEIRESIEENGLKGIKVSDISKDGETIDEGLLSTIVGGVIGGTAGKSVMQAVCHALGVKEDSTLGKLLTSRMVLTAVGAYLGYKW